MVFLCSSHEPTTALFHAEDGKSIFGFKEWFLDHLGTSWVGRSGGQGERLLMTDR